MALQMSWQPSLHILLHKNKRRKTGSPPLGLRNLGNTCYLNSVLQCLTYTPPLAYYCLNNLHSSLCSSSSSSNPKPPLPHSTNCPFCLLEKRIVRSLLSDLPLDSPSKIQSCLNIFADHFRCGRQEDAHEFLRYVIDACHNTCLRLLKNNRVGNGDGDENGSTNSTIVKDIFGGELRSQVKCLSCGAESNKTDEIMDISLDLFHCASLKDAMQRFFQPEVLDGTNKYKCDKCKKLVVAKKQMSILKAPNVLVVQLKRFEGILGGKIDRVISFEEILLLSSYMCNESQDPRPEYNLFGSIVHSGYSPDSGHYYAYIKDANNRWYCCNDSHVSASTLQEVLSEKVYILFFSRTNQRSRPTKSASSTNGVKSLHRNGNGASPTQGAALPLKSVAPISHGALNTEKVIPPISKNGTVHSSPPIKFGYLKTLDSKRVNGNGNTLSNGHVEKHINMKESSHMEKSKNKMASMKNNNFAKENECPDAVDHKSKQKLLLSQENGQIQNVSFQSMETEVPENSGLGHITSSRLPDSDHLACGEEEKFPISGHRRKSLDQEFNNSLQDGHTETIDKLKNMIADDVSSRLQSCGWCDEVQSVMRARKRLCVQTTGNTTSKIELKKIMIAEAKQTMISRVPESLKQHLVDSLRAISGRRGFLDA